MLSICCEIILIIATSVYLKINVVNYLQKYLFGLNELFNGDTS